MVFGPRRWDFGGRSSTRLGYLPRREGLYDRFSPVWPIMIRLALDDLCLNFGGLRAVNHVSFGIESGAIHGLIGPNGAGKTSLFNCITGFYRPTSGTIRFAERDITG